jgi:hypothetical protein
MERQACLGPRLLALGLPVPDSWRLLHDAEGRTIACAYRFVDAAPAPRAAAWPWPGWPGSSAPS